ncbi:hypothetical protein [Sphingomonas sp. 3P27F8]|uniref:hypothetical protein n=1 Tax=Sphingomonas sp. 3P27F8 TaxID=2502213 RepID=UPI0010FA4C4B|nr:hypothetical protein [Sphingomonas sp. 3P27F8]
MINLELARRNVDKAKLAFDLIPYCQDRITLLLLEKDKGGSGSTGTAMSLVELFLSLNLVIHIVDFADTQLDLEVPYSKMDGVMVHRPDREPGAEEGCVLRAITAAKPGEVVIAQFPGSSIARIERVHRLLLHAQSRAELPVDTAIIWTMDSDQNSSDVLSATMDSPLPGSLLVNWPHWNGAPRIAPDLAAKIAAIGGRVFAMPELDPQFYHAFKADRRAPRTTYEKGDFVERMQIDLWLHTVAEAVGARW